MATFCGEKLSRAELLAHVGDISQIARVKPVRLVDGPEENVFSLEITNGSGLAFSVLPSRGMDISTAQFNGRSIAWRSSTGDTHPAYFDHEGEGGRGWLRAFYGGLVVTCGLGYAGAGGQDGGLAYGLHGRISNTPAQQVQWDGRWDGDEYVLTVRGTMRETTVFGENLRMTRTIVTRLGSPKIQIRDVVENMGYSEAEHMILYHINIGFPVVAENARLLAPSTDVTPRDAAARPALAQHAAMESPRAGFQEQVYFHELAADEYGFARAAVVNPACDSGAGRGLGVYCSYPAIQLPRFTEWKMLDAGTYVVGMEPANCSVLGRAEERARGTLQTLRPGEERQYDLEIGVLAGPEDISHFESTCRAAAEVIRR